MTPVIVAAYADPAAIRAAAEALRAERFRMVDAFTPFPVELGPEDPADDRACRRIGWAAAIAGLGTAALVYALEWYSAAIAFPFDSGGRPLNSWPVFLLAPFEIGVLAAAIAGLAAFLLQAGLPRLHHPAFEIRGIARASRDRFFLAIAAPDGDDRRQALAAILHGADVWEGEL
jgi:hypothetical protein